MADGTHPRSAPWANVNTIVCVSIESLEGLDNVATIAAVEGIDMIAYGRSDFSARLGVRLQHEHPTFNRDRGAPRDATHTGPYHGGSAD
jgi:2-keto-3-deoxy-L-rhamnonate aldolase RhmA